jgi:signal transduction histidine kinase
VLLDSTYSQVGDFRNAYNYLRKFIALKDSVFTKEQTKIITELNAKFDVENKRIENEILRIRNDRQNIYIIVGIIILIIIATFGVVLYFKNRTVHKINSDLEKSKKKVEDQNFELETMNIELDTMNQELIHANEGLKELNTMKDKFFSIISHDLKGPVYAQSNIISIMADDFESVSEQDKKEYLELLNESTTHTTHLLENLLTWGRSQMNKITVNYTDFDLYQNIEQTVSLLRTNANLKNITIENHCPEGTMMKADPNLISTVIRNVTNNSIKFTPDGGTIKIEYSKPNIKDHLVTISDNGVGMDQETASYLFRLDKAKSTPGTKDEKGTGLGLIIVKEFIDKHNGSIWVKSEIGKGTKTFFTIPVEIEKKF